MFFFFHSRLKKALLTLRISPRECMCSLSSVHAWLCAVTSKHLVMSQRTAVEGLLNYSSRGGEAGGGRKEGRNDGCWDKIA